MLVSDKEGSLPITEASITIKLHVVIIGYNSRYLGENMKQKKKLNMAAVIKKAIKTESNISD